MKSLWKIPLKAAGYVLGSVLIIAMAPLLILIITLNYTYSGYERLWKRLRKDPNENISLKELNVSYLPQNGTVNDYLEAFNNVCLFIAKYSKAKLGKSSLEGSEILKNPPEVLEWATIKPTQELATEWATVELSVDLGIYRRENAEELSVVSVFEEEDASTDVLPITATILKPTLQKQRSIAFNSEYGVWAVISLLRGDAEFSYLAGQLWAYIPERKIWIVQYKNGVDFGQRRTFKKSYYARKFNYDRVLSITPDIPKS